MTRRSGFAISPRKTTSICGPLIKSILNAAVIVDDPMDRNLFGEAVDLYRLARRQGVTVRSSIDCLIAASAIRHGLTVLHSDRDYSALAGLSELRERPVE